MLNALLSGPNPNFCAFIDRIKDDIDSGTVFNNHMYHHDLATASWEKYNNMVASVKYYKLDSKDSKIIALTITVTVLEQSDGESLASVTSGGRSGGRYKRNQAENNSGVEKWLTVKKTLPLSNTRGRHSSGA